MKKRMRAILLGFALVIKGSVSAEDRKAFTTSTLPASIQSLAVRQVVNDTAVQTAGKLRLLIVDRLIRDGRVPYQDDERSADGVLVSTVRYYRNTPVGQSSTGVANEYQMWLIADVSLLDRKSGEVLWSEPNFQWKVRYRSESEPGGKTEENAQEDVWQKLASDIVRRTLDGPGSIESLSPRTIPKLPSDGSRR